MIQVSPTSIVPRWTAIWLRRGGCGAVSLRGQELGRTPERPDPRSRSPSQIHGGHPCTRRRSGRRRARPDRALADRRRRADPSGVTSSIHGSGTGRRRTRVTTRRPVRRPGSRSARRARLRPGARGRHGEHDREVVVGARMSWAPDGERAHQEQAQEGGEDEQPDRVADGGRVHRGREDLRTPALGQDHRGQVSQGQGVAPVGGGPAGAGRARGEVRLEAAALGRGQREVDRGGGEGEVRCRARHGTASADSSRLRTRIRVRHSRVRVAASERPIAAAISAPEKPSDARSRAARAPGSRSARTARRSARPSRWR